MSSQALLDLSHDHYRLVDTIQRGRPGILLASKVANWLTSGRHNLDASEMKMTQHIARQLHIELPQSI